MTPALVPQPGRAAPLPTDPTPVMPAKPPSQPLPSLEPSPIAPKQNAVQPKTPPSQVDEVVSYWGIGKLNNHLKQQSERTTSRQTPPIYEAVGSGQFYFFTNPYADGRSPLNGAPTVREKAVDLSALNTAKPFKSGDEAFEVAVYPYEKTNSRGHVKILVNREQLAIIQGLGKGQMDETIKEIKDKKAALAKAREEQNARAAAKNQVDSERLDNLIEQGRQADKLYHDSKKTYSDSFNQKLQEQIQAGKEAQKELDRKVSASKRAEPSLDITTKPVERAPFTLPPIAVPPPVTERTPEENKKFVEKTEPLWKEIKKPFENPNPETVVPIDPWTKPVDYWGNDTLHPNSKPGAIPLTGGGSNSGGTPGNKTDNVKRFRRIPRPVRR